MDQKQIQAALMYISIGIRVFSARLVLLISLFLTFGLFCWAMWNPNTYTIACATIFAVLIFIPATWVDKAQSEGRAAISPKESS